jgi:hypothetical protein
MPQLWGNEWLFLGYGKKIEDCAATAVLNKLDVREGPQGDIHPSVYSFRYPSPRCFSCPLLSVPFPDILAGVSLEAPAKPTWLGPEQPC